MQHEPFVIERTFNAPANKVWDAITNKDQMKEWYFNIADFKPEMGFEFTFNGTNEGETFVHLCKITEVIPGRKLTHSWTYKDYSGESFVTWELYPEGNKTRLVLTHRGLETFPDTAQQHFAKANFEKGWTYIIGTSLPNYLEKA